MKHYLFVLLGLFLILVSCVNTKKLSNYWVYKNQNIYSNYDTLVTESHIRIYNLNKGIAAKIKDDDGEITISNFDTSKIDEITDTVVINADGSKRSFHYPSVLTERVNLRGRKEYISDKPSFKYLEISPIIQAATIPFKYRPKQDTINYALSTSGNLGIVYGLKFSHHIFKNIYNKDGNMFNSYKSSISITPGVFIGPATVGLTSMNTHDKIEEDITVLGLNSGVLIVFGVNRFNIGGAVGLDYAFGSDGSNWIYNGKPWFGFVLSLDFID